jgi:signal transduction histidine kinase
MSSEHSVIHYSGLLDDDIRVQLIELLQAAGKLNMASRKEFKRLFTVAIEMLDNAQRHSSAGPVSFRWSQTDERITLSLTNLALRSAAIRLDSIVTRLRDMTEAQLVEAFKLQLSDPSFGENGGAGLGLLQIARKVKGNITTRIEATDQEHCRCHCEISATLTPAQAA